MAIYYVDQTGGDDSKDGLSQTISGGAGPWKTISKVNGSSFSAGDSILFKKGETWRETLTVPSSGSSGNVITFGAYGSGANPIITAAESIGSFSLSSGNIWDATVTTRPYMVMIGATVPHAPSASKVAIAGAGDWFWAANVLSVYATSDPSGTVEAAARNNAIDTNDKIHLTFDGFTLRAGNQPYSGGTGTFLTGTATITGITLQNCTVEYGANTGVYIYADTNANDWQVKKNTIRYCGGFGILPQAVTQYTSGLIDGNNINNNGWRSAADGQQMSGIQGQLGNVTISNNSISANVSVGTSADLNHGIYAAGPTGTVTIFGNTVFDHLKGDGIKIIQSANVYRNTVYGNKDNGIECGMNSATNVVYAIYYNLVYGNGTASVGSGIVEQSKGAGTISLTIENNTCYQQVNTLGELTIGDGGVNVLTVKNNLLFAPAAGRSMQVSNTLTGTVAIDNNLHWRPDGNPNLVYAGAGKTWAQWKALGFDTNGVNSDPLLVNPTSDFKLQAGSPAINAGVDLGLTADRDGNPMAGLPDMGAFEYQNVATLYVAVTL